MTYNDEKVSNVLEWLELCSGLYDLTLRPDESENLFNYIKQLLEENKQLKNLLDEIIINIV